MLEARTGAELLEASCLAEAHSVTLRGSKRLLTQREAQRATEAEGTTKHLCSCSVRRLKITHSNTIMPDDGFEAAPVNLCLSCASSACITNSKLLVAANRSTPAKTMQDIPPQRHTISHAHALIIP